MTTIAIDLQKPETVEVEVPSYPGSSVTILKRIPIEFGRRLNEQFPKAQTDTVQGFEAGIETLVYAIKAWNFTDPAGEPFDISKENIAQIFGAGDISLLSSVMKGEARHEGGAKWRLPTEEEKKR